MAPLPGSPVSNSTASESQSFPTSEDSSDNADADSLTTPKAGPTDPAQRSAATLSQPSVPPFSSSPGSSKSSSFKADSPTRRHQDSPSRTRTEGQSRNLFTYPSSWPKNQDSRSGAPQEEDQTQSDRAERQKSVSFSTSASLPKPERLGSYSMMGRWQQPSPAVSPRRAVDEELNGDGTAESSSADESTAIFKKSGPNYGAADAGADEDGEHEEMGNADEGTNEEPGTVRKRKGTRAKGRGSLRSGSRGHQPAQGDADDADEEGELDSWWRYVVENYGSVELENKGSVARDHLALERTFLAWLRTSLSFASIGVAVTQLFRLNTSLSRSNDSSTQSSSVSASSDTLVEQLTKREVTFAETHELRQVGKPLGATFLGISILILLLGFHRYFESQHYVIRGKFPASRGTIIIVSFVATALIVASLVVVLAVAPSAFEKK